MGFQAEISQQSIFQINVMLTENLVDINAEYAHCNLLNLSTF